MGGSAPETPTLPDAEPVSGVRASDAERDEVVAKLTEEFASGRLSQDTFLFRMSAVLQARHQADLQPLLADLPSAPGAAPSDSAADLVAPGPVTPPPVPPTPGDQPDAVAATAAAEPRGEAAAGGQSGFVGWLRTALPRRGRADGAHFADAASPPADSGPGRRLTGGLPRAGADARPRPPAPLYFPRGTGPQFSIGRDANCDLAISDMTVSRVHARLERTADGWLLTDLSSTNGTRVNGWRVRGQVRVQAGDLVSFGSAEYSLSAGG